MTLVNLFILTVFFFWNLKGFLYKTVSSENRDNFTSFLIWISCWQFFKGKIHLQAANSSWYRTMLHWHFQSTPRSVMLLPLASNSVINWASTFLFVIILFEICEEIMGWYITTYYSQYWSELSWTCLKISFCLATGYSKQSNDDLFLNVSLR